MQVGDRHDDMDLRGLGVLDRTPDRVDLISIRPRQRGHSDAADLTGDAPAGIELAGREAWETSFDDVHAQLFELPGDAQLGGGVQVEARRLLAIAQRRVKNEDAIRFGSLLALFTFFRVHLDSSLETRKPPPRGRGLCDL